MINDFTQRPRPDRQLPHPARRGRSVDRVPHVARHGARARDRAGVERRPAALAAGLSSHADRRARAMRPASRRLSEPRARAGLGGRSRARRLLAARARAPHAAARRRARSAAARGRQTVRDRGRRRGHDVVAHAAALRHVPVSVTTGAADPFLPGVRAFGRAAPTAQVRVVPHGCHDDGFWRATAAGLVAFVAAHL